MRPRGDADSADLFTSVSRGVDKSLWFVEAHEARARRVSARRPIGSVILGVDPA